MKVHSVVLATAGLLTASCNRPDHVASQDPSVSKTEPTEKTLEEKKKRLVADFQMDLAKIATLHRDIGELEITIDELREQLALLDIEKKQMYEESVKLRMRWEKETEYIQGDLAFSVSECFRITAQRIDQLLQENQELKRRLEESGK